MPRTARLFLAAALLLGVLPVTGNAQEAVVGPLSVPAIVAAPFSAVGITETTRQTADGNRFSRTGTVRFYRDTQGRTRTEREVLLPRLNANGAQSALPFIEIRDTVSNEPDASLFEIPADYRKISLPTRAMAAGAATAPDAK